jgi:hypothetical protein
MTMAPSTDAVHVPWDFNPPGILAARGVDATAQ